MKAVLLTTDTLHHRYFVQETAPEIPWAGVLIETGGAAPPFETAHPFEALREDYEAAACFAGAVPNFEDFAPAIRVPTANESSAVMWLHERRADFAVVFGTGRLREDILHAQPANLLNLHGGDPEEYRGLDSHLWAIYHGDFDGLVTTLHHVNAALDDGPIVERMRVPVCRAMKLHQLRKANTEICIALVRNAWKAFGQTGQVDAAPQTRRGRYYSFMPAVLKEGCVRRFERHTERLP